MKLEAYGLIGDLHTAALVGINGSIDWLCLPRFDSPACFAALLGDATHGCWRIAPVETPTQTRQTYQDATLILETEFTTSGGTARLIDFMPTGGASREVIRRVEGLRGSVDFHLALAIRLDYGSTLPWVQRSDGGISAIGGPDALVLKSDVPTHGEGLVTVADFTLAAGESKCFVLGWHQSHEPAPPLSDPVAALDRTRKFWTEWSGRCRYQGEWREKVVRSLLTLKALTFAPTGGIIAAPTTSLPEKIAGVRNWDYRYCWLRDATFTLYSLMQAGYTAEAIAWSQWLLRAAAGDPAQLQILYGPAGERRLPEIALAHLPGYENSRPVHIGNVAAGQFQLDIYGEIMDAMHVARLVGIPTGAESWALQRHLIDFVEKNWMRPDDGIWEIRGPRRHFTHSKMMAWVAIDRAVKAVESFGLPGDVAGWRKLRDLMHADVCRQGFNPTRQAFTQHYGSHRLDASLLMMPLVGFLPATDARVVATIEAIQSDLVRDGFVYRYHPENSGEIDGLPPGEGAFLPCSFWLVDCLYLMGRKDEARHLFARLLETANGLGLLAEEYEPKHQRLVGNYPQAFSHVGLINSARNLSPLPGPADQRGT
jgi:GH15 family glucan-1,4-alpha-glucosidase